MTAGSWTLLLVRKTVRTMPWVTVTAGCLAGTVILAAYAYIGHSYHMPLSATTVRLTFLPAIATLAFVLQAPFRPLAQAAPVPAWLAPAIQVVLAIPVLALTCWVQLSLRAYTYGGHGPGLTAGAYPHIAQLAGWSAIFVAATACCDRSRYADISGMIAVPVSLVIIALASFAPGASSL